MARVMTLVEQGVETYPPPWLVINQRATAYLARELLENLKPGKVWYCLSGTTPTPVGKIKTIQFRRPKL